MAWEAVDEDRYTTTTRLEVPGGWLYRVVGSTDQVVFVPCSTLAVIPLTAAAEED